MGWKEWHNWPAAILIVVLCPVLAKAQLAVEERWQLELLKMEDGDTLHLPAGTYTLTETLLVDGLDRLVIQGAGREQTVLDFAGQAAGAEGLKVTNCTSVTLRDFAIFNTAGDAIKAQGCTGIDFLNVETSWSGKPASTNGSYGLYPVQCEDVLIDGCKARGASDAGIYVGQSDAVIVRNCHAVENVAGIEIENTTNAEVYDNLAEGNTGGILVFDLPGLIKKQGGDVVVHHNRVLNNNLDNFAPKGNIVASVPPGTGVMVLATPRVTIRDNQLLENKTASVAVVSYYLTELPIADEAYEPIPREVQVYGNNIARSKGLPTLKNRIGLLLAMKFWRNVPGVIWDGITPATLAGEPLALTGETFVCFGENGTDTAVLDAARKFKSLQRNPTGLACSPAQVSRL